MNFITGVPTLTAAPALYSNGTYDLTNGSLFVTNQYTGAYNYSGFVGTSTGVNVSDGVMTYPYYRLVGSTLTNSSYNNNIAFNAAKFYNSNIIDFNFSCDVRAVPKYVVSNAIYGAGSFYLNVCDTKTVGASGVIQQTLSTPYFIPSIRIGVDLGYSNGGANSSTGISINYRDNAGIVTNVPNIPVGPDSSVLAEGSPFRISGNITDVGDVYDILITVTLFCNNIRDKYTGNSVHTPTPTSPIECYRRFSIKKSQICFNTPRIVCAGTVIGGGNWSTVDIGNIKTSYKAIEVANRISTATIPKIINKSKAGGLGTSNTKVLNRTKTFTNSLTANILMVGGGGGGSNDVVLNAGGSGGQIITYNNYPLSRLFQTVVNIGYGAANGYRDSNNNYIAPPSSGGDTTLTLYSTNPRIVLTALGGKSASLSNSGLGGYGAYNVNPPSGANGGNGISNSITGTSVTYAGGGAAPTGTPGTGSTNAGGGGTGAGEYSQNGIVVISYPSNTSLLDTVGATLTTYVDGSSQTWQVHTFNGAGFFTIK